MDLHTVHHSTLCTEHQRQKLQDNMKRESRTKSRGQETQQEREGALIEVYFASDTVSRVSIAFLSQLCCAPHTRTPKDRFRSTNTLQSAAWVEAKLANYGKKGSEPLSFFAPLSSFAWRVFHDGNAAECNHSVQRPIGFLEETRK